MTSIELASKLLAKGADINARMKVSSMGDGYRNRINRQGATAFWLAAKGIDPELSTVLINGEIGLVGASGEFFCNHALRLRGRAGLPHLLFVGYCNGHHLYFPTIEQLLIDATLGMLSQTAVDDAIDAADTGGDASERVAAMIRVSTAIDRGRDAFNQARERGDEA